MRPLPLRRNKAYIKPYRAQPEGHRALYPQVSRSLSTSSRQPHRPIRPKPTHRQAPPTPRDSPIVPTIFHRRQGASALGRPACHHGPLLWLDVSPETHRIFSEIGLHVEHVDLLWRTRRQWGRIRSVYVACFPCGWGLRPVDHAVCITHNC